MTTGGPLTPRRACSRSFPKSIQCELLRQACGPKRSPYLPSLVPDLGRDRRGPQLRVADILDAAQQARQHQHRNKALQRRAAGIPDQKAPRATGQARPGSTTRRESCKRDEARQQIGARQRHEPCQPPDLSRNASARGGAGQGGLPICGGRSTARARCSQQREQDHRGVAEMAPQDIARVMTEGRQQNGPHGQAVKRHGRARAGRRSAYCDRTIQAVTSARMGNRAGDKNEHQRRRCPALSGGRSAGWRQGPAPAA